jgi:hypothetical protein
MNLSMRAVKIGIFLTVCILGLFLAWRRMDSIDFTDPKAVLNNYIEAELNGDLNRIVLTTKGISYSDATKNLGPIFANELARVARETKNVSVQKWQLEDPIISDQAAKVLLRMQVTDGAAIAAKVDELTGFIYDEKLDRVIFDPSRKKYNSEEARKIALADKTIHPIFYHLTMELQKINQKWLVNTKAREALAFISIVENGSGGVESEPFRSKSF